MSFRNELTLLSKIHTIDLQLKVLGEAIAILPSKSNEASKKASEVTAFVATLSKDKEVLLQKKARFEQSLANEKANVRKWESRADKIRGERDYAALVSEIGAQKKAIQELESGLNESIAQLKAKDIELSAQSEKALILEKTAADELAQVQQELDEKKREHVALNRAKDETMFGLPAQLKARYMRIAPRRGGLGVAIIDNEVCQQCMRTVPPELSLRVKRLEVIEQCPYCQRIMVDKGTEHIAPPRL